MGASEFAQFAIGKDLEDAFTKARDEAAWEFGHGGYTGSLAEKGTVKDLTSILEYQARRHGVRYPQDKIVERIADASIGCWDGKLDDYTKKRLDKKWHGAVLEIAKYVQDKWGPAGALELRGARAKALKKGTRGKKAYIFFGIASM